MKKLLAQIFKFGLVGGSAFVIDYGLMILLVEIFGMHYLLASGISFSVSVIYNYLLSVHWVFDVEKGGNKKAEFAVFLILSVIGLGLNQVLMWLFTDKLGLLYMLAKVIATAIVMVYNFITRKIFLER